MPQLLKTLDHLPAHLLRGAVAVGNFDGVHMGHARLIEQLVATAKRYSGPAVVMTFDPPPSALLFPERRLSAPLTSIPRRAELLFALGVDAVIAYPTDTALLSLTAEEFFQSKIVDSLQARSMVEGPNFRFGRDRTGDVQHLRALCAAANIDFQVVDSNQDAQGMISSTRIRQCLLAGQIVEANRMLTQPYTLQGIVVPGAQRGSQLGFATANLSHIESMLPASGVYAGRVQWIDAHSQPQKYAVALNIGPNPTFEESNTKVEAHLIGYAGGPLYTQRLEIALLDKIRDVRKFDSIQELQTQIAQDVAACAKFH
jgi:riboflavin kinase/FMN adenylyltransferase